MKSIVAMGLVCVGLLGCADDSFLGFPPHERPYTPATTASATTASSSGSTGAGGEGGGGTGGDAAATATTGSSASTGAGGCDLAAMPGGLCLIDVHCVGSTWVSAPAGEGTECANSAVFPWSECDGAGMCVTKAPPGCGTALLGMPDHPNDCDFGCDDGNDCTLDSCFEGACKHVIFTTSPEGSACAAAGLKCSFGYCCDFAAQ